MKRHQVVKTREVQERGEKKKINVLKTVLRDTIVNNNSIFQDQAANKDQSSSDSYASGTEDGEEKEKGGKLGEMLKKKQQNVPDA